MTHTHTPEQLAIISHCRDTVDPLVIEARAGSGKTATLLALLRHLRGTTSIQAFNKSIAVELQLRASNMLTFEQQLNISISTCHSHGLSAFKRAGQRPNTLQGKVNFMLKDELKSYRPDDDIHRNSRIVSQLVSAMKNSGFGLVSPHEQFPSITDTLAAIELLQHHRWDEDIEGDTTEEEIAELAAEILTQSNRRLGSIDFDDMIYLPLLHNMKLPLYDNMLLDEAQDINPTRREMAFRSLTPSGRVIAVGDSHQAIYGFTGADVSSLQKIRDRAGADVLPLTICFRCDANIIAEAQRIVPDIRARDNAPDGLVQTVIWDNSQGQAPDFLSLPQPGDAILCRLNKPNVAVALGLIRRGVPAKIEGRDLGKRILHHVQKATPLYAHQDLGLTLLDLANYKEQQLALLFQKKREDAMDLLSDEVDCASLLIERVLEENMVPPDGGSEPCGFHKLEAKVESLFGDNVQSKNTVTLSSIHKAKGREWPRVFILGWRDYMPFHRAQPGTWQMEQEHNLQYVAQTRAERTLVYVNGVQSAIDRGLHREGAKPSKALAEAEAIKAEAMSGLQLPDFLNQGAR